MGVVTEDVNRANVKYLDMFKKFGQEVKSRSLAVRDEVNARMARYPVSLATPHLPVPIILIRSERSCST
jgi:hypothetical protein